MSACWSKPKNRAAPTTIFSNCQMSPRQIATKVLTLGCKKLDRDSRRTKLRYDTRIRVLINNQIQKAEEALSKRTRRTNRRVMAAEDDDSGLSFASTTSEDHRHQHHHHTIAEKSPLCASGTEDTGDDGNDHIEQHNSLLSTQNVSGEEKSHALSSLSSERHFLSPSSPAPVVLTRDCRPVELAPSLQRNTTTRIESIM